MEGGQEGDKWENGVIVDRWLFVFEKLFSIFSSFDKERIPNSKNREISLIKSPKGLEGRRSCFSELSLILSQENSGYPATVCYTLFLWMSYGSNKLWMGVAIFPN